MILGHLPIFSNLIILLKMKKEEEKSLEFHVEVGDYFGTLASVLTLINEKIESTDKDYIKVNHSCLKSAIKDLMYLQKEYKIIKK